MLPFAWPSRLPSLTSLGTQALTQTAGVDALLAGIRYVDLSVPGVVAGDFIQSAPLAAPPLGYALVSCVATATNTVRVFFNAPLLNIGQSFSFNIRLAVLR